MKIDQNKYYRMPLIIGPIGDLTKDKPPQITYTEVDLLVMQYQTDFDAIQALLPDCYRPDKEPTVTILFSYNNGLDFMAGGGYVMAAVEVAARFDGERDHIAGDYMLVVFENDTRPIIGGREELGAPKIYADISPIKTVSDGHLRCEASIWGHLLFGFDLAPLEKQNPIVRLAASKMVNARPSLAYKYIPTLDGPPDANYPTTWKMEAKIEQLWMGNSGEVYFGAGGPKDIGEYKPIMDALKTLPVRKITHTLRLRGSGVLRYDLYRRLL
jgi:acetoacetate decarboxylase